MVTLNTVRMQKSTRRMILDLVPESLDVAEIGSNWGEGFNFQTYTHFPFPDHDICAGAFTDKNGKPHKYDLIMADQIWAHLEQPYTALRNVRRMLKKGARFWLSVPFLTPYQGPLGDYSRWNAQGLTNLLVEAGFERGAIEAFQWGNHAAVLRNLEADWPPEYDEAQDDLESDHRLPVCAWAMAQKT